MLKQEFPDIPIDLMVVENDIPGERRLACERQDIEVREISEKRFREVADQPRLRFYNRRIVLAFCPFTDVWSARRHTGSLELTAETC
jgi:hypothetical protein